MPALRIALCQINVKVGDLDGNVATIVAALAEAEAAGADLAVFPEGAVTGYPAEDLVLKPGFVRDNQIALEQIAARTGRCAAVIGFVDGPDLYNAAALCANGAVVGTYHKRALPNYDVFDEKRYFRVGAEPMNLFSVAGVKVGMAICEDAWTAGGPMSHLGTGGAELIVHINGSPMSRGKMRVREEELADRVEEGSAPIAYVNLVGGQDELIFDGGSMVVDAGGTIVARCEQFVREVLVFDLDVPARDVGANAFPVIHATDAVLHGDHLAPIVAPLAGPMEELYEGIVLGTRDYLHKNGFTDICLGLSGGIDSSLVAAIAAEALGADHVHGVLMPSRFSSDHSITDAVHLAEALGIEHRTIAIEPGHVAFLDMLAPSFGDLAPDVTEENLQSRIRGVLLMALANKFGWLVLTTGNKSEAAVGYSTLYGDTAGAYACIKDVYKLDVYRLSNYVNKRHGHEVIPEAVIDKPPSAELRPDQRDDQSLPPYDVLDPLLEAYIEGDATRAELIVQGFDADLVNRICRLVDISEFKRRQTPIGARVTTKGFGRDRRLPITNGYRK